jgi:hypothetical protein
LVAAGERQLGDQGCRRITALVVRDEDHATAFWPTVDYDLDERIDRYVKTAGS